MQGVKERTVTSHRQSGDGTELFVTAGAVGLFDMGDQLFKKHVFVGYLSVVLVDIPGIPGIRHDNDHRHGLVATDGTVGNFLHLPGLYPHGFIIGITVQQVKHRIITFGAVVSVREIDRVGDFFS